MSEDHKSATSDLGAQMLARYRASSPRQVKAAVAQINSMSPEDRLELFAFMILAINHQLASIVDEAGLTQHGLEAQRISEPS